MLHIRPTENIFGVINSLTSPVFTWFNTLKSKKADQKLFFSFFLHGSHVSTVDISFWRKTLLIRFACPPNTCTAV